MKKKLVGLTLLVIVGTLGVTFSSFVTISEDENAMQEYWQTCPNGGSETRCGVEGPGCTPQGGC